MKLGAPDWFALSDRDLAACLYRHHFLAEGGRLTAAQAQIANAVGVKAAVLPMCEQPVHTRVQTAAGWRDVQEYLVVDRAEPEVEAVELRGISSARPTAEVTDAIADAELIVIGPSNPVISIGPILAVPGIREAIMTATAPVVAVSPYVAGKVVKGPTEKFMRAAGPALDRRWGREPLRGAAGRHGRRPGRPRPAAGGDRDARRAAAHGRRQGTQAGRASRARLRR